MSSKQDLFYGEVTSSREVRMPAVHERAENDIVLRSVLAGSGQKATSSGRRKVVGDQLSSIFETSSQGTCIL